MVLASRDVVRADRVTDVTMDVTDEDIFVEEEQHRRERDLRALMTCPTKRVEPRNYPEAQEEARLGRLRLLGRFR
jgi:hypothetical protein